jgi:PTH2 family peptidyl-tRNA hydrolase
MDKVIQTIVMRSKFPYENGEMRKLRTGKYVAQASHASIAFLTNKFKNTKRTKSVGIDSKGNYFEEFIDVPEPFTEEEQIWIDEQFTKICLCVDTEEELLDVYNRAKEVNLTVHLIQDAGHTEFNGLPTYTCLAIGPHYKSKIDVVTKDLRLF